MTTEHSGKADETVFQMWVELVTEAGKVGERAVSLGRVSPAGQSLATPGAGREMATVLTLSRKPLKGLYIQRGGGRPEGLDSVLGTPVVQSSPAAFVTCYKMTG